MKKALQKILAAGLVSAMALGTLAGCGSSETSTATTESQPEVKTEEAGETTPEAAASDLPITPAAFPRQ